VASKRYVPVQRWAIDLDWQQDRQRPSAIAIPYGYRTAAARRPSFGVLLSGIRQRHLTHGLLLTLALGVIAGSAISSQQPSPAQQAPATDSDGGSSLRPSAAIVARVVPETQTSRQAVPLALPDESRLAMASAPVTAIPAPELKSYEVQDGDNPFDLAQTFNISEETLLAANGLDADSVLQIGQKLLVPPVSGVVVSTQPGETPSSIADQWKLDLGKLLAVNKLNNTSLPLSPGEPLVLPDAQPPVSIYPSDSTDGGPNAAPAPPAATAILKTPATSTQRPAQAAAPAAAPVNLRPAIHPVSGNYFPWGQCTYWAAQQRPDIGSRVIGNAASWLYSARAAGLATGTVPRPGAIVVYQPGAQGAAWTGHVAYVTSVTGDGVHFSVSEMNFPWWGRVTTRSSWTGPGVAFIY
jgi:surface antigen